MYAPLGLTRPRCDWPEGRAEEAIAKSGKGKNRSTQRHEVRDLERLRIINILLIPAPELYVAAVNLARDFDGCSEAVSVMRVSLALTRVDRKSIRVTVSKINHDLPNCRDETFHPNPLFSNRRDWIGTENPTAT